MKDTCGIENATSAPLGRRVEGWSIQGFANAHPWLSFVVALRRPFRNPKRPAPVARLVAALGHPSRNPKTIVPSPLVDILTPNPMQQLSKHLNDSVDLKKIMVEPGKKIALEKDFDPGYTGTFKQKQDAEQELLKKVEQLAAQQDVLYASHTYALLLVFQAMDAAGKDGTIKHVMSGVNPQGCQVFSFKSPSAEELNHDYLWRTNKCLPERGRIGIFNRSYYEELLVVRVHPEFLSGEHLPAVSKEESIWKHRFEEINNFERYLTNNGIIILKFFLNVSKKEQKTRFLTRIEEKEKNWKFSANDIRERRYWADYMAAYEDTFNHTSTEYAPWFVIPADHKWYTRLCVSQLIVAALKSLDLKYPKVTDAALAALEEAKKELLKSDE